jgi:MoxR-like ATPase
MQEQSVTIGGKIHRLKKPFFVMATQNPIEQEGTYPLPEAQLDRFFFKLEVGYSTRADLREILARTTAGTIDEPQKVIDAETIIRHQKLATMRRQEMELRIYRHALYVRLQRLDRHRGHLSDILGRVPLNMHR